MSFVFYEHTFVDAWYSSKRSVFLMASVPSRNKMYKTSAAAAPTIHAAVHFFQKADCMMYTLQKKFALSI
jgi:hypothetical protein